MFLPVDGRARRELQLTVNFGTDGQCVTTTYRFLCYIQPNASKFSISNKNGFVKVVLSKEADFYNVCSTALPLSKLDDSEFDAFTFKREVQIYLRRRLNNSIPQFSKERRRWLHDVISDIFAQTSLELSERKTTYQFKCKDQNDLAKMELQIAGYFSYKNIPLVKLLVLDLDEARRMVENSALDEDALKLKRNSVDDAETRPDVSTVSCDDDQLKLMRKLLLVNSFRLLQADDVTDGEGWYWNTFLQILFRKTEYNEATFNGGPVPQPTNFDFFKHLDIEGSNVRSIIGNMSYQMTAVSQTCVTCSRTDVDLMTCKRCGAAYYCNRDCQRRDWKTHKTYCRQKT